MSNSDDRELFLENIKEKSLSLGLDDDIFKKSKDLIYDLDAYDYNYL